MVSRLSHAASMWVCKVSFCMAVFWLGRRDAVNRVRPAGSDPMPALRAKGSRLEFAPGEAKRGQDVMTLRARVCGACGLAMALFCAPVAVIAQEVAAVGTRII